MIVIKIIYLYKIKNILYYKFFPNSSTVERLAVNEDVLGSNPSLGEFGV